MTELKDKKEIPPGRLEDGDEEEKVTQMDSTRVAAAVALRRDGDCALRKCYIVRGR